MADAPSSTPLPPPTRSTKPVSEALLNEKVQIPQKTLALESSNLPVLEKSWSLIWILYLFPSSSLDSAGQKLTSQQWDHAISSLLIRSSLGLSFGVVFSVLLFKRRAWPAWVGLGFGAGRAWEEADGRSLGVRKGVLKHNTNSVFK